MPNITVVLTDAQARAVRREIGKDATAAQVVSAVNRFVSNHADQLLIRQRRELSERLSEVDPVLAAEQEAAALARLDMP